MDKMILEIVTTNSGLITPHDLAVLECVDRVTKSNIAKSMLWNLVCWPERVIESEEVPLLVRLKARGLKFYDDLTVKYGCVWENRLDLREGVPPFELEERGRVSLLRIKRAFPTARIELHGVFCDHTDAIYNAGKTVLQYIDAVMRKHNIAHVKLVSYPARGADGSRFPSGSRIFGSLQAHSTPYSGSYTPVPPKLIPKRTLLPSPAAARRRACGPLVACQREMLRGFALGSGAAAGRTPSALRSSRRFISSSALERSFCVRVTA